MEVLDLRKAVSNKEEYILLTHLDLDGAGCAIVFYMAFSSKQQRIYYCGNGKEINEQTLSVFEQAKENPKTAYHVFIADNSISEDTAKKVKDFLAISPFNTFILLDHHKSALWLNNYSRYPWASVDVNECGTTMMLGYFNKSLKKELSRESMSKLNKLCEHIKNWDLYTWEKNNDKQARFHNALCRDIGLVNYTTKMVKRITIGLDLISVIEYDKINERLDKVDRYVDDNIRNYSLADLTIDNEPDPMDDVAVSRTTYHVAITFATAYVSELGNAICKRNDNVDICALINLSRGDFGVVELRTVRDDIDLSVLAKSHGGGGHPKAAGFPLDMDTYTSIIESITKALN